jgi:8-oxo-dGTP diphosphatase
LIARRAPSEKLAGFWEFPGGKVDGDESLASCLVREIREELGVNVIPGRTLCESDYVYEHGSFRIVAIEAEADSHDFELKVHDKVAWMLPEQIEELPLLPADKPIIEILKGDLDEKVQ